MLTVSLLLIIPFFVLSIAGPIWFVVYVIRAHLRQISKPSPLRQIITLVIGLILFALLGCALVAPTGPGSGKPLFVTLLVPCFLFLIIGPGLSRVLAVVIACACVIGVVSEDRARERFREYRRMHSGAARQEAVAQRKENPELDGPANRSQPIRPETNRTSAAPGSGR